MDTSAPLRDKLKGGVAAKDHLLEAGLGSVGVMYIQLLKKCVCVCYLRKEVKIIELKLPM